MWTVGMVACGGGVFAAWHYTGVTEVDVAVARVRRGDFIISVRTRGEIKSTRSVILTAPQVPDPRIVKLAESGKPVKKGDVVVEFDPVQQEQNLHREETPACAPPIAKSSRPRRRRRSTTRGDGMNLMTSEYNVERAKLEASKAEILSEIEGAKDRIDVGVSEGELGQVKTTIKSREDFAGRPTWSAWTRRRTRPVRDTDLAKRLSLEDGDPRADRRHREYPAEFPLGRIVRPVAAAVQRRRPGVDRRRHRRNSRSVAKCASS